MLPRILMRPIARIRPPIPGAALAAAALLAPWLPPSTANATPPTMVTVTTGNNDGAGSLREALESGATMITFSEQVTQIDIEDEPLEYSGTQALRIQGSGQSIVTEQDLTLLIISAGADLEISGVAFHGAGGFSAEAQGTGKGIELLVPSSRVGVVDLELSDVLVVGVAGHGVHVDDDDSEAAIGVRLNNVMIDGVGHGMADADGLRVDERGAGNIVLMAGGSSFNGVGADGIELDEDDAGDVIVDVWDSTFEGNGAYCAIVEDDPTLDPDCFDDDGDLDLDDGFDIDEAGEGSLEATLQSVSIHDNHDEGLDFDEAGAGHVVVGLFDVHTSLSGDEGIKCSEEDDGDVTVSVHGSSSVDDDGDGMQFESEDDGRTDVELYGTLVTGSGSDALEVSQDDSADLGTIELNGSTIDGTIDLTNVEQL